MYPFWDIWRQLEVLETDWGVLPQMSHRACRCCVFGQSYDCRHCQCSGRSEAAPQRMGPAKVERQCLQQADRADLLTAMHQKARHAAVLDDAMRPFGQLAPSVGLLTVLARHSRPPRLHRGWLVAAFQRRLRSVSAVTSVRSGGGGL